MATRRQLLVLLAGIVPALGASYRTTNFIVYAPTAQIAQQFGQAAEHYRKEKSRLWLGYEMPPWGQPCPIHVKVTMHPPGGATSFIFDNGQVLRQNMEIEGPLDRLLASVLPHEITHTVFAYYFRQPVPRWADEGGSVLSEDEPEKQMHDKLVRQILNAGQAIPLRRLFSLRDYPREVMCLYAEGFSMAHFLVASWDRQTYLKFVAQGMTEGWDRAVQTHYGYNSVEQLENAWLAELRRTKRQPAATMLAGNTAPANAYPTGRTVVRLTAPPAQPLEENPAPPPVYRGLAPSAEQDNGRFGDAAQRPTRLPDVLPASNPRPASQPPAASTDGWQPVRPQPTAPVEVQLLPPQVGPPSANGGQAVPGGASPVGYPR
jgi:hypothetical protein